jgi:hypothetical protein
VANKKTLKQKKQSIPVWIWIGAALIVVAAVILILTGGQSKNSARLPLEVSVTKAAEMRAAGLSSSMCANPVNGNGTHSRGYIDPVGRTSQPPQ